MIVCHLRLSRFFFFFNDTATTEIYTLSLHDALPISPRSSPSSVAPPPGSGWTWRDRKSTRLNSSHSQISYAVFCLKKKKEEISVFSSNVNNYQTPIYNMQQHPQ